MDEQRAEHHTRSPAMTPVEPHSSHYVERRDPLDGSDEPLHSAAQPVPAKRPSMLREIAETLLLALIIFVAVRAVVLNFRVDGRSMEPDLADNEMLLVNRNAYFAFDQDQWFGWIPGVDTEDDAGPSYPFGKPEHGDIIVLNPPPSATADKPYIKRVIGEPGDTVELRDGGVYINEQRIEESYIDEDETPCNPNQICGPLTVPQDAVFVLGDNRDNSEDSRVFGIVPIENIIGKAWLSYWPRTEVGFVPHEDYPELDD